MGVFPLKPSFSQFWAKFGPWIPQRYLQWILQREDNSFRGLLYGSFEKLKCSSSARLLYGSFGELTFFYIGPFFGLNPETKNTISADFWWSWCEKHVFQKKLMQSCLNFSSKTRIFNKKSSFLFIKITAI